MENKLIALAEIAAALWLGLAIASVQSLFFILIGFIVGYYGVSFLIALGGSVVLWFLIILPTPLGIYLGLAFAVGVTLVSLDAGRRLNGKEEGDAE